MLPLLERLRITLLERESEHRADRERVYSACANQLCFHASCPRQPTTSPAASAASSRRRGGTTSSEP